MVHRLPEWFDEPFADSSQIPTYLVSAMARGDVKVALSGDGGDELFAGYTRYRWALRVARTVGFVPPAVHQGIARCLHGLAPSIGELHWLPSGWLLSGHKLQRLAQLLREPDLGGIYRQLM